MLTVQQLTFSRNDNLILKDINLKLQAGELLQISGPNGAGKTTLLKLVAGLLVASEGKICWQSVPIEHRRSEYYRSLVYLDHQAVIKAELTVYENLMWLKSLHGQSEQVSIQAALEQAGLKDQLDRLAKHLSAGQQRRLNLAKLILFPVALWLLDEPFTALDKSGHALLESLLLQHLQKKGMVIVTSHQMLSGRIPVHHQLLLWKT